VTVKRTETPTFALITPGGSTLGPWELDDDQTEPGSIVRRPGQPDRRVIGLLEVPEEDRRRYEVLIVERV
jgi:hypothetical protein